MAETYFQFLALFDTAIWIASRIHSSGNDSAACFSSSPAIGVSGPMFCSYAT